VQVTCTGQGSWSDRYPSQPLMARARIRWVLGMIALEGHRNVTKVGTSARQQDFLHAPETSYLGENYQIVWSFWAGVTNYHELNAL
jgi:hypothetical protein